MTIDLGPDLLLSAIDDHLGEYERERSAYIDFASKHGGRNNAIMVGESMTGFPDGFRWKGDATGPPLEPVDAEQQLHHVIEYWRHRRGEAEFETDRINAEVKALRTYCRDDSVAYAARLACIDRQDWKGIRERLDWLKKDANRAIRLLTMFVNERKAGRTPGHILRTYFNSTMYSEITKETDNEYTV